MKTALIGYTGFVGSNIADQYNFDDLYNSKNINDIKGKSYDLLVCAGIKAVKWYANAHEEEDYNEIFSLFNTLKEVDIKHFVLISSVDVYPNCKDVDEDTEINPDENTAYGKNRYLLEETVKEHFKNHTIIRLPALFGKGLKKNFIYDCLTLIPSALKTNIYNSLIDKCDETEKTIVKNSYELKGDMYYFNNTNRELLIPVVKKYNVTSLMFSDYRDTFQLYPLNRIWKDISFATENNIEVCNLSTEPVTCKEIYKVLFNDEFTNELNRVPVYYDMHSKYGYLLSKEEVFEELRGFKL